MIYCILDPCCALKYYPALETCQKVGIILQKSSKKIVGDSLKESCLRNIEVLSKNVSIKLCVVLCASGNILAGKLREEIYPANPG
jgi:hypothetical protein